MSVFNIVLLIHAFLCALLITLVLLQQGKGADAGAILAGGSNTLFGAGGATKGVTRLTTTIAILFMITSIILAKTYNNQFKRGVQIENPINNDLMQETNKSAEAPAKPVELPNAAKASS